MKKIIEKIIQQLFKGIGFFHSDKIIYFESFHGNQYSDNPKAIYEWMTENHPEYNYIWGVSKGHEESFLKEKVPYVVRFSIKWFLTMPRARAWVINTRTPLWLTKNKKTMYIQTWHGTPLKKIGQDIPNVNIPGYTKASYDAEFSAESKRWDYLVSPNSYSSEIFKHAFDYKGPVLEVGYPRNDLLVRASHSSDAKLAIMAKLNISNVKRVILYAPTWRETAERKNGNYTFDTAFPFDEISQTLSENTILLVRMHYLVAQQFDFSAYEEQMKDVSVGFDMSELLAISDLLITDYSSCLFDFAITNKPMLFYIPDQEEYEKEMRGFYFPMENEMPGELVKNQKSLIEKLEKWQEKPETLKTTNYVSFKRTFTELEKNQAAQKVGERIIGKKESTNNGDYK